MEYYADSSDAWTPLPEVAGNDARKSNVIGYARDFGDYGHVIVSAKPDASGRYSVRHADPGSDDYVIIGEASGLTPEAGMSQVTEWANHSIEFVKLGRRSVLEKFNTPWGPVSHAIHYGEGIRRVFAIKGSGYELSDELLQRLPSFVRDQGVGEDGRWFPDDSTANLICFALPEFFTSLEIKVAGKTSFPDHNIDAGLDMTDECPSFN